MPYPSSSSSSRPNRSILKCPSPKPAGYTPLPASAAVTPPLHCSVRFPSSPKLSTVHYTHCPISYDRRPIEVSQNTCAMPERQCDGYNGSAPSPWSGKHVHPSVLNRMYEAQMGFMPPPALSSDDGSSEDSDGVYSPPPEAYRQYVPSPSHLHSIPSSHPPETDATPRFYHPESEYSMSFLPHAPPAHRSKKPKRSSTECAKPIFAAGWGAEADEASCLGGF